MQNLIDKVKSSPSSIFTKDDVLTLLNSCVPTKQEYQTFYKHQEIVDAMGLRHQAIPLQIAYGTHDEIDSLVKYELITAKFPFESALSNHLLALPETYLVWHKGDEIYAAFRTKEAYDEALYNGFIDKLNRKIECLLNDDIAIDIEGDVNFSYNQGSANIEISLDFDTNKSNQHSSDRVNVNITSIDAESLFDRLVDSMRI